MNEKENLEKLISNEYEKLSRSAFNFDAFPKKINQNGLKEIDIDALTEEQKQDLDFINYCICAEDLKKEAFRDFVEHYSECNEYDSALLPTDYSKEVVENKLQQYPSCFISDTVDLKSRVHFVNSFGENVPLNENVGNMSVDEQLNVLKQIYYNELMKRGYTDEEIINACTNFSINELGGKITQKYTSR